MDQKTIGYCGYIFQIVDGVEQVEISYRLHPDYWAKGLATEAASAVKHHGFHRLGIQRLVSIIESENAASINVATKIGMQFVKKSVYRGIIPVGIYAIELGGEPLGDTASSVSF